MLLSLGFIVISIPVRNLQGVKHLDRPAHINTMAYFEESNPSVCVSALPSLRTFTLQRSSPKLGYPVPCSSCKVNSANRVGYFDTDVPSKGTLSPTQYRLSGFWQKLTPKAPLHWKLPNLDSNVCNWHNPVHKSALVYRLLSSIWTSLMIWHYIWYSCTLYMHVMWQYITTN